MRKYFMLIPALIILAIVSSGCTRAGAEAGEVNVVRNGGPYDNKSIKGVQCPGGNREFIGYGSTVHPYPSADVQRYYKVTSDPGEGADLQGVITVKSADGFNLHIGGTMQFKTKFTCEGDGKRLVEKFDRQFGSRKFPQADGGSNKAPWDGEDGWAAFLNGQFLPVLQNEFRIAGLKYTCDQIVASCALVASREAKQIDKNKAKQAGVNLQEIQSTIEKGFEEELQKAFGDQYFSDFKFLMGQPTLDGEIEGKIRQALGAFAVVSTAEAQVQQAQKQAEAAKKLAAVYRNSPQLAELEKWRIICGVTNTQGGGGGGGCDGITVLAGVDSPVILGGRGN